MRQPNVVEVLRMKTSINTIRLVLWTSQQESSNISVEERFWLFPAKHIARSEITSFIKTCETVGDELYYLIHRSQIICNLLHILNISNSTLHRSLYQSMLYIDNKDINDTLESTTEALIHLYQLLMNVKCGLCDVTITDEIIVKLTNRYVENLRDNEVLDVTYDSIVDYIKENI